MKTITLQADHITLAIRPGHVYEGQTVNTVTRIFHGDTATVELKLA